MSSLFSAMFPDSNIAKNYTMSETKLKYLLEFGVAPYLREMLIVDMQAAPFSFLFDETTTSQVKKQYDGYVQFESKQHKKIVSLYVWSLFLGHCPAEALKEHFFDFGSTLKWNVKLLLHIGMDEPNVNKAFHRMLEEELSKVHGKTILNIGTCSLHPIHTAFSNGLKKLSFDFDKLPVDLHFFFKHSSARRRDFELCELETYLEAQMMMRHVSSRWLSLKKVLTRILDQWPNLKEYFLVFLPKQNNFNQKIHDTERYKAIARALQTDESRLYMSFAIYRSIGILSAEISI